MQSTPRAPSTLAGTITTDHFLHRARACSILLPTFRGINGSTRSARSICFEERRPVSMICFTIPRFSERMPPLRRHFRLTIIWKISMALPCVAAGSAAQSLREYSAAKIPSAAALICRSMQAPSFTITMGIFGLPTLARIVTIFPAVTLAITISSAEMRRAITPFSSHRFPSARN